MKTMETMTDTVSGDLERRIYEAIAKLRNLREGDHAVVELISCGHAAIKPLRDYVFTRDPSGMYQPRCQAITALAALGAKEALTEILTNLRTYDDPVEQTGEDAVASAAARALTAWKSEEMFSLLLRTAENKLLPGVIEALGDYRREEAMPVFSVALAEDFCRHAAENAFIKLGARACPALLKLATRQDIGENESETSHRQRRSALNLFAELYRDDELPRELWRLTDDNDPWIAFTACSLCMPKCSVAERRQIVDRLIALFSNNDWRLRSEIKSLFDRLSIYCSLMGKGKNDMPYRPCAGITLVNDHGLIFLAQRQGYGSGGWQMPQGGIDMDEKPQAAALRELSEEIGTDKAEIIDESADWYEYDYPPDAVINDRTLAYRGQRQKWFLMRFIGQDSDINIGKDHPEFQAWRWATPNEVIAEAVAFKRSIYEAVLEEFGRKHGKLFYRDERSD